MSLPLVNGSKGWHFGTDLQKIAKDPEFALIPRTQTMTCGKGYQAYYQRHQPV